MRLNGYSGKFKFGKMTRLFLSMILIVTVVIAFQAPMVTEASSLSVSGDTCTITGDGSAVMTKELTNDGTWYKSSSTTKYYNMQFTNNSSTAKAVVVDLDIDGDFSSMYKPTPKAYMTLVGKDKCTGKFTFTIQPGRTHSEKIVFTNSHKGTFLIKANVTASSMHESSTDKNNPQILTPGVEKKGNGTATGYSYYSLTLDEDSAVKINFTGSAAGELRYGDDNSCRTLYKGSVIYLKKGRWYFRVACGNDGSKTYSLTCNVENYDYGTVETIWKNGSNKITAGTSGEYTIKYKSGRNFGLDNESRLISVGSGLNDAKKIDANTYEGSTDKYSEAGYLTIPYIVSSPIRDKQMYVEYVVLPARVGLPTVIKGTNKTLYITYSCNLNCGKTFVLQRYKGKKWVKVKTIKTDGGSPIRFKVGKLKGNTVYKFRVYGKVYGTDGKPSLKSKPSKVKAIRTAPSSKPSIKSIKVYNTKVYKHKRVWSPGHWSGGHWYPGRWYGGGYSTSYKVRVTLKKPVKGAKGMIVNGKRKKGSGKTYTISCSSGGKLKGKKVNIKVRMCTTNSKVVGPSVTKKMTLR